MHPDEQALLRSVIENPDDDVPRLVIADWYEENGQQERAEFIRLQIQLERTDLEESVRVKLHSRENQLLRQRIREWTEPLVQWNPNWELEITQWLSGKSELRKRKVVRGFLHRLDFFEAINDFLLIVHQVYEQFPIQFLSFQDDLIGVPTFTNESFIQLADCPYLKHIRTLELQGTVADGTGLLALFNSSGIRQLQSLKYTITIERYREGSSILLSSAPFTHLKNLSFTLGDGRDFLRGILQSTNFPNLERLELRNFHMDSESADLLIQSEFANRLKEIRFRFYAELGVTPGNQIEKKLRNHFGNRLKWI
jgi:uncharacterized protein (TIGR02996 family)